MKNVKATLDKILQAFENNEIPEAVAIASFPIPNVPSTKWSFCNRTIQFLSGTADARGYKQWQAAGRQVKKGAKALHILSPCFRKVEDTETAEQKEVLSFFKETAVFKAEDTEGEELLYPGVELPELPFLERAKEWDLTVRAIPGNMQYYGYYSMTRKEIAMATPSEKTFFHELSHAADHRLNSNLRPGQDPLQEVTAELCAQALARMVGKSIQDTTGNSYQYISRYAKQLKITPHQACLKVLTNAEKIINLIIHG